MFSRTDAEKMGRGALRGSKIFLVIARIEDRRHPVVDRLDDLIGLSRNDCEGLFPFAAFRVFPQIPYAGHSERLAAGDSDLVFKLLSSVGRAPFKEGIRRDNATALLE